MPRIDLKTIERRAAAITDPRAREDMLALLGRVQEVETALRLAADIENLRPAIADMSQYGSAGAAMAYEDMARWAREVLDGTWTPPPYVGGVVPVR